MHETMEIGFWQKTTKCIAEHTAQTFLQHQCNKKVQKQAWKLPPEDVEKEHHPGERVGADLMGPLSVDPPLGKSSLNAAITHETIGRQGAMFLRFDKIFENLIQKNVTK